MCFSFQTLDFTNFKINLISNLRDGVFFRLFHIFWHSTNLQTLIYQCFKNFTERNFKKSFTMLGRHWEKNISKHFNFARRTLKRSKLWQQQF
jgi:hypothetical protein